MKNKYDKAEENVTKIVKALQNHQVVLMKDIAMLDKMYRAEQNLFQRTFHVHSGRQEEAAGGLGKMTLRELMEKAERSGLPEDAQEAKDLDSFCNRFEKNFMIWSSPG